MQFRIAGSAMTTVGAFTSFKISTKSEAVQPFTLLETVKTYFPGLSIIGFNVVAPLTKFPLVVVHK